jgi:tetratricopeptide (TPR) repeat protein
MNQSAMQNERTSLLVLLLVVTIPTLTVGARFVPSAQSVIEARLSAREAYVGSPIVLQIQINNAEDYQRPPTPKIDGCDIRFAGAPQQSSQITIINGVRSEKRVVTLQYIITPRRAGTFEIPALPIKIDGRQFTVKPQRFVATKSETGDLMFVEVEGGKDRVYVGQALDMKLKIWVKPYRDMKNRMTLSEATMWRLVSPETSWGSFAARLQQMADDNQRPRGQEVLRADGSGRERAYYLYEIDATVYPKRPGKIDADDIQIVVQYPTALGRSRDPFEKFFQNNSPFGRDPFARGGLSNLLDDDFFSGSPFGNRLAIKSARPIVAEANVDETEVLPVPMEGRPDDYRGAVGQYRILTQATPTSVTAGDPVTLNIGIAGTGPMELVQAPPLATMDAVTKDFKVSNTPLAGFVQDDTKLFSTTIRPRNENVKAIPPISFSFFDPDQSKFVTVKSDPISISVSKAESLSLDTIAGTPASKSIDESQDSGLTPDFGLAEMSIVSERRGSSSQAVGWGWWVILGMPIAWLAICAATLARKLLGWLPGFRRSKSRALQAIDRSSDPAALVDAIRQFVENRTRQKCESPTHAIGALRSNGLYSIASDVESFFANCQRTRYSDQDLRPLLQQARQLVEEISAAISRSRRSVVRRLDKNSLPKRRRRQTISASMILIVILGVGSSANAQTDEHLDLPEVNPTARCLPQIELTKTQAEILAAEFVELYQEAMNLKKTDQAEAKERFNAAAKKGQLVADAGFGNGAVYLNLGNAYLQSGQLGRAIACYETAKSFDQQLNQASNNLRFADSMVQQKSQGENTADKDNSLVQRIGRGNHRFVGWIGESRLMILVAVASLLFWGLLILATTTRSKSFWIAAIPASVLLAVSFASLVSYEKSESRWNGVLIVNHAEFRAGDGPTFATLDALDGAEGERVRVLSRRENWVLIQTATGTEGWLPASDVMLYGRLPSQSATKS